MPQLLLLLGLTSSISYSDLFLDLWEFKLLFLGDSLQIFHSVHQFDFIILDLLEVDTLAHAAIWWDRYSLVDFIHPVLALFDLQVRIVLKRTKAATSWYELHRAAQSLILLHQEILCRSDAREIGLQYCCTLRVHLIVTVSCSLLYLLFLDAFLRDVRRLALLYCNSKVVVGSIKALCSASYFISLQLISLLDSSWLLCSNNIPWATCLILYRVSLLICGLILWYWVYRLFL